MKEKKKEEKKKQKLKPNYKIPKIPQLKSKIHKKYLKKTKTYRPKNKMKKL